MVNPNTRNYPVSLDVHGRSPIRGNGDGDGTGDWSAGDTDIISTWEGAGEGKGYGNPYGDGWCELNIWPDSIGAAGARWQSG